MRTLSYGDIKRSTTLKNCSIIEEKTENKKNGE